MDTNLRAICKKLYRAYFFLCTNSYTLPHVSQDKLLFLAFTFIYNLS